jgi:hypothetical protein
MRSVIVIVTSDDAIIHTKLQAVLIRACQIGVDEELDTICSVEGRFNRDSAIDAVKEMYNAE